MKKISGYSNHIDFAKIPLTLQLVEKIKSRGGQIYLVGGACRDLLLDRKPRDYDFAVSGFNYRDFGDLFPEASRVGRSFPVIKYKGYDFILLDEDFSGSGDSTGREEVLPAEEDFKSRGYDVSSLEEDLKSRDFSINALACELSGGQIIDPTGGLNDLCQGLIRHLPGAFRSDPLRIYRAARFAAELTEIKGGFKLADSTKNRMFQASTFLGKVAPERIFRELRRVLRTENPEIFFAVLYQEGILKVHFPELDVLSADSENLLTFSLQALSCSTGITDREEVRFAVLVHALGAGTGDHENDDGLSALEELCARLRLPGDWKKAGRVAVKFFRKNQNWIQLPAAELLEFFHLARRGPLGLKGLEQAVNSVYRAEQLVSGGAAEPSELSQKAKRAQQTGATGSSEWGPETGLAELGSRLFCEVTAAEINDIQPGPALGHRLKCRRREWLKEELQKIRQSSAREE